MHEFILNLINSNVFVIGQIAIVAIALFLTGLSVKAWKNTHLKKMIFLIIAFGLFAITHLLGYVDQSLVNIMSDDVMYAMFSTTEITIMLMFVLAILKK